MFQVSLLNRTQKIQNNSYFGFYYFLFCFRIRAKKYQHTQAGIKALIIQQSESNHRNLEVKPQLKAVQAEGVYSFCSIVS